MKRTVAAVFVAALVFAPGVAGAGAPAPLGQMEALPQPATTDDEVIISNADGAANTCEGGLVLLWVEDEDAERVFDEFVTPNPDGTWSQSLGMLPAGDYFAEADCGFLAEEAAVTPAAQPFFAYEDLEFTVTQAEPTTTLTSPTTTAAPATTAAAAATATPRFTG
jgi:hypothetical protein